MSIESHWLSWFAISDCGIKAKPFWCSICGRRDGLSIGLIIGTDIKRDVSHVISDGDRPERPDRPDRRSLATVVPMANIKYSIALASLTLISISMLTLYNYPSISKNYYIIGNDYSNYDMFENKYFRFGSPKRHTIKIAVTSCGDRTIMEETFVMIKSAVTFTKHKLHFIIFVDRDQMSYADQVYGLLGATNCPSCFICPVLYGSIAGVGTDRSSKTLFLNFNPMTREF